MSNIIFETHPVRILLVDRHAMVREGLRLILNNALRFSVVGEAGRHTDAIILASREQPDIILLDLTMISENGYSIVPRLLEVASSARLIILTESLDPQTHRAAIKLGAKGLVLKQESSEALIKAINKVNAGEISLEPAITEKIISDLFMATPDKNDHLHSAKSAALTPRERQVVRLVAEGLKNKEIARTLLISEATVSHHLTSIFNKLGISGRLQLAIYAHHHSIDVFDSLCLDDRPDRN